MLDALSAEALKIRHHKATWFLVWGYPALFAVIFAIAVIIGLAGSDQDPNQVVLGEWIEDTVIPWIIPAQAIGRYLIAAFVAVVFAGEYGWNTWKLVVPHRSRVSLIAAKYMLVMLFFALTFTLTAAIATAGTFAEDWATSDSLPAGLTAGVFFATHADYMLAAIAPLMVTIGYASLAAILTRSTIAGLVISLVVITIEELLFKLAPVIASKFPAITDFSHPVLPGYHLANIASWLTEGTAQKTPFPDGVFTLPVGTSIAVVAAWVIALCGLTIFAFRRQDIN